MIKGAITWSALEKMYDSWQGNDTMMNLAHLYTGLFS